MARYIFVTLEIGQVTKMYQFWSGHESGLLMRLAHMPIRA